jgi:SAM-dependent methyltransferase
MAADTMKTNYFDEVTPHYGPQRCSFAVEFIKQHATPTTRVIDVGCGDGAVLNLISREVRVAELVGVDTSARLLERAKLSVGCRTIQASILDGTFVKGQCGRYNFCLMLSVLHHLVGATRTTSYRLAQMAVGNALTLLASGGHLIILEPTYGPQLLMTLIFWIKRAVGSLTSRRLELFASWVNIGQPVVSYLTVRRLDGLLPKTDATLCARTVLSQKRLGFIIKEAAIGIVAQKA